MNEIDLGVIGEWFGNGGITTKRDAIKFWVGANFEYEEDTDIYLYPHDFDKIAEDAKRIAEELRAEMEANHD